MANAFKQLEQDTLQARKSRAGEKATLLTTVLAQVKTRAIDDGHREANDEDVVVVVRQFLKSANENIELAKKNHSDSSVFENEKNILQNYLPQQMSEEELTQAIKELAANNIGEAMKGLKEKYHGRYDGKLASQIVKKVLS